MHKLRRNRVFVIYVFCYFIFIFPFSALVVVFPFSLQLFKFC